MKEGILEYIDKRIKELTKDQYLDFFSRSNRIKELKLLQINIIADTVSGINIIEKGPY